MLNQLTIQFKDKTKLVLRVPDWSESVNTREYWNPLFDWYQHSAMESYQLNHNYNTYVFTKLQVELLYSELVEPNQAPQMQYQLWLTRIKALFTST